MDKLVCPVPAFHSRLSTRTNKFVHGTITVDKAGQFNRTFTYNACLTHSLVGWAPPTEKPVATCEHRWACPPYKFCPPLPPNTYPANYQKLPQKKPLELASGPIQGASRIDSCVSWFTSIRNPKSEILVTWFPPRIPGVGHGQRSVDHVGKLGEWQIGKQAEHKDQVGKIHGIGNKP